MTTSKIIDIDSRRYPSLSLDADGAKGDILLTVLVKRIEGTFKAYAALVPDNSREDPHYKRTAPWVLQHGNALREDEATRLFHYCKGNYAI